MKDPIVRLFWKIVKFLFLLEMVLLFTAELFRHVSIQGLYFGLVLASVVAYVVYSSRHPRETRQRPNSGGERTPVLPRRET